MAMVKAISINNVDMSYPSPDGVKEVLKDVNYAVTQNSFVSIVGPSGVGKTTLLRLLTGLMTPTAGTIEVDGNVISAPPPRLAVVLQDYTRSLMPWLTVGKNISLPLRRSGLSKAEIEERVMVALDEVGLTGTQKLYPWQMSGGMQQRASIARALAVRPSILIMDEPFASVDAQTRFDLEDLVLKLRSDLDITTLMVTHDIDEAVYLSDEIVVLYGKPASVREVVKVDLSFPRSQIHTRNEHRFAELRTHVYALVRGIPESEANG